ALDHGVLGPDVGADQPIDSIADPQSPVALLKEPKPWLRDAQRPRRAGVSAFGFGGTNFHAVLEEAPEDSQARTDPGHAQWPCELVVVRGATREELVQQIRTLQRQLTSEQPFRLRDVAWTCSIRSGPAARHPFCLATVVTTL